MLNSEKYREILNEYEQLREASRRKQDARKELVYKTIPEIKEIDEQVSLTSINIAKTMLKLKKEERQLQIKKLKDIHTELLERKKFLLLENNFNENFLEEEFVCSICEDKGYYKNKMCKCFRQKIIEKVYDMYALKDRLRVENFDNFDFSLFSPEVNKYENISPLENIRLIFKTIQDFVNNFDNVFSNIIFYGQTGSGKTFLCNCIAKDLLDKGNTVIYITAYNLFELIEKIKFNKGELKTNELEQITEADLLIIDDLGAEFITLLSSSSLFNIINERILQEKSTIISTNLSPEDMLNNYSSRVVSRFYGYYQTIKVFGKDIRIEGKLIN